MSSPGYRGHLASPSFSGITSFLRRPVSRDLDKADLAITGIPFDCATTNRPGARFGPRAIREASTILGHEEPYGWPRDPLTEFSLIDYGDLWFDFDDTERFTRTATDHIKTILEHGVTVLALGGDHYISYPLLKAHAHRHGPLSLIQFDAHTDTWDHDGPGRINHGTMFRQAIDEGLILPGRSVQVGIRTSNNDTMGVNVIDARTVHEGNCRDIAAGISYHVGDNPVYITFDIDCLDPAFAPGTGTPVWGGLSSAQAGIILNELKGINLVGMDVVEVSPSYDHAGITALAAAHVAYDLLCLWACGHTG